MTTAKLFHPGTPLNLKEDHGRSHYFIPRQRPPVDGHHGKLPMSSGLRTTVHFTVRLDYHLLWNNRILHHLPEPVQHERLQWAQLRDEIINLKKNNPGSG